MIFYPTFLYYYIHANASAKRKKKNKKKLTNILSRPPQDFRHAKAPAKLRLLRRPPHTPPIPRPIAANDSPSSLTPIALQSPGDSPEFVALFDSPEFVALFDSPEFVALFDSPKLAALFVVAMTVDTRVPDMRDLPRSPRRLLSPSCWRTH
jgi:hypothetical protein